MFRTIRNSCFGALLLGSCSSLDLSESNSGVARSNESLENSISLLQSEITKLKKQTGYARDVIQGI